MEHGEQAADATAEAPGVDSVTEIDSATMEDAMAAIVVSGDALVVENDDHNNESVNDDTASVASDGTMDLEQMDQEEEEMEEEATVVEPADAAAVAASAPTAEEKVGETTPTVGPVESAATDANHTNNNTDVSANNTTDSESKETAAPTLTVEEKEDEATPASVESAATDDANNVNTNATNAGASGTTANANTKGNNSSASSSSESDSSSSSDSDSSDSDVEDVTDKYKKSETLVDPLLRTMSEAGDDDDDDDEDEGVAEQWFEGAPTLESVGVEVVGVMEAPPEDAIMEDESDDDDDEDVFLLPFKPDPKLERGSATKRQRPQDDAMAQHESAGEETTSSEPEPTSDDELRHRRRSKSTTPRKKAKADKSLRNHKKTTEVYTEVPSKYDIFNNVPNDDSKFPFLKGQYEIRATHRAVFTGHWGFTEADFKTDMVSKFEYSSGYLHGRRDGDQRPFSGIYGGYFNLRQFSGKISKIKEDHIELHFVRLVEPKKDDEGEEEEEVETTTDESMPVKKYEVFGEGKNRYGRFLVRGYFSAINGRMTVRRHYLD